MVQRYAAARAGPSPDAASAELHETPGRPVSPSPEALLVAPSLEALLDEPSRAVPPGGP